MVLINVDFPRPVCPVEKVRYEGPQSRRIVRTHADNVELEASLEQLSLDLASN